MPPHRPEWVFDTAVLSAFAVVGRLDLLERRYARRAQWCIEVHDEITRGIATTPSLGAVLAAGWLDRPIQSFAVDRIERMRQRLGGQPGDDRHRGVAAAIVVAADHGWVVAMDDREATRVARSEGLRTIGTQGVLQASVKDRLLECGGGEGAARRDDRRPRPTTSTPRSRRFPLTHGSDAR